MARRNLAKALHEAAVLGAGRRRVVPLRRQGDLGHAVRERSGLVHTVCSAASQAGASQHPGTLMITSTAADACARCCDATGTWRTTAAASSMHFRPSMLLTMYSTGKRHRGWAHAATANGRAGRGTRAAGQLHATTRGRSSMDRPAF